MCYRILSMHSVLSKTTQVSLEFTSPDGQKIITRKRLDTDEYIFIKENEFNEKKSRNENKDDFYIEPFAIFIRRDGVFRCAVSCKDKCFDNTIKEMLKRNV